MMTGKLYIDGIDVYANYGLYAQDQGYNNLIQWASLKGISYNDWYEEDGIEIDLSGSIIDSRTCSLKLCGVSTYAKVDELINALRNTVYHTIEAVEIGRTYSNLRYITASEPSIVDNLWQFELSFVEDNPIIPAGGEPKSNIASYADYAIDGRLFTDYGVRILGGTRSSLCQIPSRKTNWELSSAYTNGIISGDKGNGRCRDYKATLRCLMRAESLAELWNNYDALFAQMTSAGEHFIDVLAMAKRYPYYYQASIIKRFYASDKIWLEFDISVHIYTTPINL